MQQAPLVQLGPQALPDLLVQRVRRVRRVQTEPPAQQALPGLLAQPVRQGLRLQRARRVQQALLGPRVQQAMACSVAPWHRSTPKAMTAISTSMLPPI